MLQLFWTGIMLELLLICIFHTPSCTDEDFASQGGGGRRSRSAAGTADEVGNPACEMEMMEFSSIAVVPALIEVLE
jgi:hypothetical protein